ncbi:ABC transporter ATP-binding protein [Mesorhizobium sp. B2-3-3]|uniref:ABC transporter ATP-binding protein n=1 Tax=Mesorhizobium sp. B2-4-15 TaxID=2589934 RepID=UPI00114F31D4|nr:ABC transporter ATP-binding protein [Mesorhizobium sp. B2-4-15]TPK72171.1 ABC transporter ATP-binding protein [Mesorhizobium sp. B2-4-15]TPN09905.1 ABC transporter ATP-binding protein [Mesorhizobium sp. B2-3-3]
MAKVELSGVSKKYGEKAVIHGVDLTVEHGEFLVFIGPSGCGKSTLLRMICGLEPISAGMVVIGGKPMRGVPPAKRGVAMVFQSYALYPHKTVAENMAFSLLMQGMPKAERDRRVAVVAETLQLGPLLGRLPKELSGGQRQRVAIGRAIVREPEVFLFDEPLSNLDAELRVQMRLELAKLHRSLGATMIYVTHDQTEAMTLADRIVVLRDGVIEQFGTPTEIYDAPCNRFVAGFMGSPKMSFLEAFIERVEGTRLMLQIAGTTGGGVELELERPTALTGGVVVGLRPEHFNARRAAGPRLLADVEFVERLGGESFLHAPAHPAGALVMRQSDENDRGSGAGKYEIGVNWRKAHLFARDGGAIPLKREP